MTRSRLSMAAALSTAAVASAGMGCERSDPATTPPSDSGGDSGVVPPSARRPSPAPLDAADGGLLARKLPRIEYRGGPFLRHPKVVTITFTKDDAKIVARLEQLAGTLTRTPWWHTVTEGYCAKPGDCIGDGSAGTPVRLDEPLGGDVSDSDVEALLVRASKARRLGAIDDSTLLLVYLPAGTALHDSTTPRYCTGGPRAFHRAIELEGKRVPFAVLPRCGDEAELTGTASHEILEATTNAFPMEHGFAFVGGSPQSGFTAAGVEPVDPCGLVTMDRHWTTESGFVVHRAWSNREAALGHDPCVPSRRDHPYVMLVPREPAVRLAHEGESITLELDAAIAGSAGGSGSPSWAVSVFDLSGHHDREQYVEVALDKATVVAGDTVKLTIKSRKKNPKQREVVAVVSTFGVHSHMWPLLVMMR